MSFTGRFLWLAFLVALTAGIGVWRGGQLAQLWLLPASLLVIFLMLEHLLTRAYKLQLRRDSAPSVELGRELLIRYEISALPKRPFQLDVAETVPDALSGGDWQEQYRLSDQGLLHFEMRRQAMELGALEFNELKMRILGVFGLAWWTRTLSAPKHIQIVPQSLTQAERRQFTREYGERATRKSGQGLELLALRNYQFGDAPRSIDWKASARGISIISEHSARLGAPISSADALKVRVMSQDQNLELTILLDVGRRSRLAVGSMRKFEHAINLASRLAQASLTAGDTLHLIAYANRTVAELYNLRGARGISRLHHTLSALQPQDAPTDPTVAANVVLRRLPRRTLLAVFSDIDAPESVRQLMRALALLGRKHLPLVACLQDPELLALTRTPDVHATPWRVPAQLLAAQELVEEQFNAVESLRAQGAVVVHALPERIDSAVLGAYVNLRKRRAVT